MKEIVIAALEQILAVFENHVSEQEQLLKEFWIILDDVHNEKKKRGYQRNPEYYKSKVRAWKKTNPEKEYQRRYQEKKKAERISHVLKLSSQGKTVSEIAVLLNISEKTTLNCLKNNDQFNEHI